ncbi:hypothetical protein D3C86_2177200 [compost metagenome]
MMENTIAIRASGMKDGIKNSEPSSLEPLIPMFKTTDNKNPTDKLMRMAAAE